jgi:hypothetical protein
MILQLGEEKERIKELIGSKRASKDETNENDEEIYESQDNT